jgi:hypothetical protein
MEQRLSFDDLDDGGESLVIVRPVAGGVGLALSKKSDGDLEVFMSLVTDAGSSPALGVQGRRRPAFRRAFG